MSRKIEVESEEQVLGGFMPTTKAQLRFEKSHGEMSPSLTRWKLDRGDAVAAVVYVKDRDLLLFVKQFRYPALATSDGWLLELIAGMVDEGELPEQAIKRELLEELGYEAQSVEHLYTFYSSPGAVSERVFLYYTEVTEANKKQDGGGEAGEGEDVEVFDIPTAQVREMLARGELTDAKTLIGVQWFLHRA